MIVVRRQQLLQRTALKQLALFFMKLGKYDPYIALDNKCSLGFSSLLTSPQIRARTENDFSYFSTKSYVVDTQKNRLDETGRNPGCQMFYIGLYRRTLI